jgi:hypothetical protein
VRRILLAAAAVGVFTSLFGISSASAEERHCYTLGDYQYCTYLPVDPGDIITPR